MFDRITFDPGVMGGRACIRGMRITVSLVVNLVANAMTSEEILREYPELEEEDIRQALQYAASLANEEIHLFPLVLQNDKSGTATRKVKDVTPLRNRQISKLTRDPPPRHGDNF